MKKKQAKTKKKVEKLINFAEEKVGKECIVKEDSILALKSSGNTDKSCDSIEFSRINRNWDTT